MIKKHKSTVTSVAWHPNSQLLATGGTDFRCRVFGAFIPSADKDIPTVYGNSSKLPFGEILDEFEGNGWVEGCDWSPSGNTLCFVSHDSSISFVNFENSNRDCYRLKIKLLPHQKVRFLSDNVVVAGGHSFKPEFYQSQNGQWKYMGSCDVASEKKNVAKGSNFSVARNIWANKTLRGADDNDGGNDLETSHHNAITDIKPYSTSSLKNSVGFSTSGLDGKIITWNKDAISAVPGLSI